MQPICPARRRAADEGFTLIELMVVVGIIAILLAIAIPTFLASRGKAQDRSAQSSLRNTLTAARSFYADGADYSKADTTTLTAGEKSVSFVASTAASTDPKTVSVNPGTSVSAVFYAAALSSSKVCYFIKDDINAGTTYAKYPSTTGTTTATTSAATNGCTGQAAAGQTYSANGWS